MFQRILCKIFSFVWRNRLWTENMNGERIDIEVVKVLGWRNALTNFEEVRAVTFYLFPWER